MLRRSNPGLSDATILLAPACASFDQFANFKVRGDAFCAAVESLLKDKVAHAG